MYENTVTITIVEEKREKSHPSLQVVRECNGNFNVYYILLKLEQLINI